VSISFPATAISNLIQPLRPSMSAILSKPSVSPRSVVATFNWMADYGAGSVNPNVNVLVNIIGAPGGAQQAIDNIRSVKIDNTGNSYPVYVQFLDTTDTIVAPPNTMVWEPVVTNQRIANVILLGAQTAGLGSTRVYFCNFFVPPYVNAEIAQAVDLALASPVIGLTNGLKLVGANVLLPGDFYNNGNLTVSGGGGTATAHGILNDLGQFTSVVIDTTNALFTGPPTFTPTGGQTPPPAWNFPVSYVVGNLTAYANNIYICIANIVNGLNPPPNDPTHWQFTGLSGAPTAATFQAQLSTPIVATPINDVTYAPISLGDQSANYIDKVTGVGVFRNNLFGTPYGQGFIYLRAIDVRLLNNPNAENVWAMQNALAAVLYNFDVTTGPQQLLNLGGGNIKLDATQAWQLKNITFNANYTVSHGFTWTLAAQ
jgi:hypothetical protein